MRYPQLHAAQSAGLTAVRQLLQPVHFADTTSPAGVTGPLVSHRAQRPAVKTRSRRGGHAAAAPGSVQNVHRVPLPRSVVDPRSERMDARKL